MAVFCLLCGKRFQTQTSLQQHMEVHADVHSYTCSECERTFPSHTALRRHLRSHTGETLPLCSSLTLPTCRMLSSHSDAMPVFCASVAADYVQVSSEKPFECKLCHQRSRDYSAMIKHLRTHNGASPYQCTVCLEYCPSLSAMQKHMKSHRPEDIPADWRIEKSYLYLCYV
ncbi:zinc finger and BTB domain-containing protein 16-A-like [Scleropages formosus]|uniref:Zinc finger and BTB domain-containing protein 16-A-like n=1 Tax=Scleropages formosus TaxID=113540 RepID=A0A0P7XG49_SCLFO|nr:zinc finger and BTB domain-containing protein 16-A-like [Scleropages formosus]